MMIHNQKKNDYTTKKMMHKKKKMRSTCSICCAFLQVQMAWRYMGCWDVISQVLGIVGGRKKQKDIFWENSISRSVPSTNGVEIYRTHTYLYDTCVYSEYMYISIYISVGSICCAFLQVQMVWRYIGHTHIYTTHVCI